MSRTICSKAWTDLNIDFSKRQLRHCCKSTFEPFPDELTVDFFNKSAKIIQRRNDLLHGIEHQDCNHCWYSYKNTGTAYRDFENKWKDNTDVNTDITFIEIMLDNICDMSCIYCDVDFSSKIASEKQIKQPLRQPTDKDLQIFVDWLVSILIDQSTPITLSFLGGEITYSKNFFSFVNMLLKVQEIHSRQITFSCLTNGNSDTTRLEKMLTLLNNLPDTWDINICVSQESTGKLGEIVRWGSNWDRFKFNFEQYIMHPRITFVCLAPTPCLFTISSMLDYFEYAFSIISQHNKKVTIAGNWVVYPTEIDVARCTEDKKKVVDNIITLCKDNKELFAFENEYHKTIKWLQKLQQRIGSLSIDNTMLEKFLEQKAIEKNDKVYLLRNYI